MRAFVLVGCVDPTTISGSIPLSLPAISIFPEPNKEILLTV